MIKERKEEKEEKIVKPPKPSDLRSQKERKRDLLLALKETLGVITPALTMANVSRTRFYEWVKEDEVFNKEVKAFSEVALDFAESQLHKNIKEGKETSTIFYLKCKGKKRGYLEREVIDPTALVGALNLFAMGHKLIQEGEEQERTHVKQLHTIAPPPPPPQ